MVIKGFVEAGDGTGFTVDVSCAGAGVTVAGAGGDTLGVSLFTYVGRI